MTLFDERIVPIINAWVIPAGFNKPINLSHEVLDLKYEDESKKADRLTLTIENDDLRHFDHPVWRTGSQVKISWGYPQAMTVERLMRIRKVTGFQALHVEAVGGTLALDRLKRVDAYHDVRYSDVAQAIAERWGYRSMMTNHIQDTVKVYRTLNQANMTDAQYLRYLAKRAGFEWYIDHEGFHFHDRLFRTRTGRTFRWNSDRVITQILDITVDTDVTRVVGSVQTRSFMTEGSQRIDINATQWTDAAKEELARRIEVGGITNLKVPGIESTYHHDIKRSGETDVEQVKRNSEAHVKRAVRQAVKMRMSVIGDPNIYAKTVIAVEGIGSRLSQKYYVRRVTHNIANGYTCELECETDGSNGYLTRSSYLPGAAIIQPTPALTGRKVTAPTPDQPRIDINPPPGETRKGVAVVDQTTAQTSDKEKRAPVRKAPTLFLRGNEALNLSGAEGTTAPIHVEVGDVSASSWTDPESTSVEVGDPQFYDPPLPGDTATTPSNTEAPTPLIGGEAESAGNDVTLNQTVSDPLSDVFWPIEQTQSPALNAALGKALSPPTLDLRNRPYVQNEDGSWSTVRSISITEDDGFTYLIPTVSEDGRIMSNDEAIDTFHKTNQHLGVYSTIGEAEDAAIEIHNDQEANPPRNTLGPTPNMAEEDPPLVASR